ncbi:MAG: hypothetical protein ICV66_07495, partial [Chitinophagaceae bacterium]|nr:hypothetical protein [Chitinophagaceae bacterium]
MPNHHKPFRRFLKLTFIVALISALIGLGLHIWFIRNARSVLKQMVIDKSHNKLKLELSQLSFHFFSNKLQIKEADLISTDSVSQPATYHLKFRKLTLRVRSLWPLLINKKLLLDSIKLHDPEVEVLLWRRDTASKFNRDEISISQEMGKIYNSMLDALDAFGIRRIAINNAKLTLVNKMKPASEPITVSDIYFDLVRTATNTGKRDEFVKDEQSVDLMTSNQNIAMPGGRHRLFFKKFNLQLFQKRIELDSCTVTAKATSTSKSNYRIFFKKLLLIGVDFDAMYRHNLIKADSVYCENPLFQINLNQSDDLTKKKERPDPDKIIQELTGDLELAFVGVKDAGIHINISGSKGRSLFNSNKDDFEIRGLRINADSSKPVVVQRFDMLVQDYRLYNQDSSTAYSFDSIRFDNNKIVLNNFSVSTSKTKQRSMRDFKIPYFELTGLDWYQLIFEQNLKAQEAVLYNPVINYTKKSASVKRKKLNLFASFATLDDMLTLQKLYIINGQFNAALGTTSFKIQNANLRLYSDKLLQSTNEEGLRSAVEELSFSNGQIKIKDITARLQNVHSTNNNLIHAGKASIVSKSKKIAGFLNNVVIDNMLLNDESATVMADGIRWRRGSIILHSPPAAKGKKKGSSITIKNISGNNTEVKFSSSNTQISTFVQSLIIASLSKTGNNPMQIKGLTMAGNNLSINNLPLQLKASSYHVADNEPSYLSQVLVERIHQRDTLSIKSQRINFLADINSIFLKNIHVKNVQAQSSIIKMNKWNASAAQPLNTNKPPIRIDNVILNEPTINIATHRNDSATFINIPHSNNSIVKASGIIINNGEVQIGSLSANTTEATFVKRNGDTVGVKKGKADAELSDVRLSQKDGKPLWSLIITNLFLQNPNSFSIGKNKNKLLVQQAALGNISLSSEYMTDVDRLIKFNVSAWLRTATGQYIDSTTTLKWYNADYNYSNRTLSLDSFVYHPTQPRDSVIEETPYQTDYIT